MAQKSLAVSFSRQLYLIYLICTASIGIIFSTYAADNMFSRIYGETFGLQLIPEAKIVFENNSGTMPFKENYFCLTIGLLIVFCISLIIFAFDFEKDSWFHPLKTLSIFTFLGSCFYFFVS